MADFQHIVEPDPEPEVYTAGPKGRATIIRGTGKCKRLHFDGALIVLGAVALVAIGFGAGRGYGTDAAILACGLALWLLAVSR